MTSVSILRPHTTPRALAVLVAGATVALMAGCANYAGIKSDKTIDQPQQFETSQSLPAQGGQWPTLDWANQFGDPQLPKLIDEALEGSPTIAQAQARLAKASSYIETSRSPRKALPSPRACQRFSAVSRSISLPVSRLRKSVS